MIQFVTGTDTGVGKTVAATVLALEAVGTGRRVAYFKPVQTGLAPGEPGDADFVAAVAGVPAEEGMRFPDPLAPAVAARAAGSAVDIELLSARALDLADGYDVVIVEGAGGLLVPLSEAVDMADFAAAIGAELVVVTRPSLGTLNHTALTLEAARRRGLSPSLVVCNWPAAPGLAETTNLEALKGMAPVLGLIPAVEGLDVESGKAPDVPRLVTA